MFNYFTDNNGKIILSFDSPYDLFNFVLQLSSEVQLMFGDPNYEYYIDPIKYADSGYKEDNEYNYARSVSIPFKFNKNINYADHGFLNLALSKAIFIYDFSKMIYELSQKYQNPLYKNLSDSNNFSISAMCKALGTVTGWKALNRRKEAEYMGENWGSATGWNKWEPNKYSKQLMSKA